MKSEMSWQVETLLAIDDMDPKTFKARIVSRIKELEKNYTAPQSPTKRVLTTPIVSSQAPSMQRLMAQNPDLVPDSIPKPPVPTTPEAANALAARQALMNNALNEKPEKGRNSPRKF